MVRRLFLERRTYRQHRLQDAARLLPLLGAILIFGPIFIRDEGVGAPTLAGELVYYFAIWFGLIVLTALVSRALLAGSLGEADTADNETTSGSNAPPIPMLKSDNRS